MLVVFDAPYAGDCQYGFGEMPSAHRRWSGACFALRQPWISSYRCAWEWYPLFRYELRVVVSDRFWMAVYEYSVCARRLG
jgi:hypothetical protein